MGALGLLTAIPAHALGLGNIELSSALNEPFKAEIPVNAVSGEEAETLQVRLASNDEFERAGLVKDVTVNQLKFTVSQKAGKTVITISSKKPIKEPLLDFLLSGGDADGLEFDLSDFDQVDEAETKLDLATAYIEMGDPEGAKSILKEIMAEGNDEQQSRATTLLNELT